MKIKESTGQKVFNVFNVVILFGIMILTLYPLLYVLFSSLSDSSELMSHTGVLLYPLKPTFAAYAKVFEYPAILIGYKNTLFIVVVGVMMNILMTAMGAYFFSRRGMMLKRPLMFILIVTMYFGGGIIPTYLLIQNIGLYNSTWSLILPGLVNTYNLIIMRTAFENVPVSLEESAKLDGAGHYRIMFRIMIPLCMPTIAVITLYYAVAHWNSWFPASMYIQDKGKYPLQLYLRELLIQNDTSSMDVGTDYGDVQAIVESIKYAAIIVSTIPILLVYPFLQRYFVKGIMVGAVKG